MAGDKVWLLLAAALCAAAQAGEPPPAPAKPPPTTADVPDAGFIEFLGSDDHGDKWWEIVKKMPPESKDTGTGAAPPQQAQP